MVTETLPQGVAALHPDWPEARFNCSGMFTHHPLITQLAELIRTDYGIAAPIAAIHGAPAIRWNAGRVIRQWGDQAAITSAIRQVHAQGIGYFPTFTNNTIEDGDMGDPACNFILELVSCRADINGVIVVNDRLSDYIRQRCPELRQVASVIKPTLEGGLRKPSYYNELGKRFFRYVVDPDDSRDPRLMDQLDRSKAEILVNENCVAFCPNRARHYRAYARLQRAIGTPDQQAAQKEVADVAASCRSLLNMTRAGHGERSCNLSRAEVKSLYDMGFRHFKLQGRADDPFTYAFDLTRFLLEPEVAAPRTQKMLSSWLTTMVVPAGR